MGIESTQGYGFTVSCSGLASSDVPFIDGQFPSMELGFRESTTLANVFRTSYAVNKLRDYKEIELSFDIAYLSDIRGVMDGTPRLITIALPGVYSYQDWGFFYTDDSKTFSARTHDHDVQFSVKIKWTGVDSSDNEFEPVESYS